MINIALAFLLSAIYPGALAPEHLADLYKSGLTDETIRLQLIRSVPPSMIGALLGFDISAIVSAYILPYFDVASGKPVDHVRLKVFPSLVRDSGTVKYLQPMASSARLYIPLACRVSILDPGLPLWVVEGEKKTLAVAQTGRAAVGVPGIEGWHMAGSRELLPDFNAIPLRGRLVEIIPDGDWRTNPNVARGARRFAEALAARGARTRLVVLPAEEPATA